MPAVPRTRTQDPADPIAVYIPSRKPRPRSGTEIITIPRRTAAPGVRPGLTGSAVPPGRRAPGGSDPAAPFGAGRSKGTATPGSFWGKPARHPSADPFDGDVVAIGDPPAVPVGGGYADDCYDWNYDALACNGYGDAWDHWYWWGSAGGGYWPCSSGWNGFSFSFGYYGGYASNWWFGFSFGDSCFARPWRCYGLSYGLCSVTYVRPWRVWYRTTYLPAWTCYRCGDPCVCGSSWYGGSSWYASGSAGYGAYDPWYSSYRAQAPVYGGGGASPLVTIDEAWSLIARDDPAAAQTAFADLAYVLPDAGGPRIGYAIAAGLLGRDEAAVTSMRRALLNDVNALATVPGDPALLDRIRSLLDVYAARARADYRDRDALLMVAALRYMLGDDALAYFAIDAAIRAGDEDPGAANLRWLLEQTLFDGL